MICKWCGARVDPAKKTCGRCGRENMPLSDCGGFYDVVPDAPKVEPVAAPVPESRPVPAPVFRPAGSPVWMKVALGVLAAAVVALGVLSIGQSGKIRELEAREKKPVLQDSGFTKPTEELTEPTDPVETEPEPEQPGDQKPESEGVLSAFVEAQAQRVAKWNIYTKQWIGSKNGPWSEETLRENLDAALKNIFGTHSQPEKLPPLDNEEATGTTEPEPQTTPTDETQGTEG